MRGMRGSRDEERIFERVSDEPFSVPFNFFDDEEAYFLRVDKFMI